MNHLNCEDFRRFAAANRADAIRAYTAQLQAELDARNGVVRIDRRAQWHRRWGRYYLGVDDLHDARGLLRGIRNALAITALLLAAGVGLAICVGALVRVLGVAL